MNRRRFLTITTSAAGGAGIVGWAWPFLASLNPSAAAQAAGAPIHVAGIDQMEPGQMITTAWRRKPIFILRRTPQMIESLRRDEGRLVDPRSTADQQPDYATNISRSIEPDYLVVIGICTHLGCVPKFRPDHPAPNIAPDWPGGFYCPCHGSKFDLAGRVFRGSPAPRNLAVPPYRFAGNQALIIGEDPKA